MRPTRLLLLVALAPVGCAPAAADGPVITITAAYPGANAQVVADTVAAPIEQQVNGAEGMERVESESDNDGRYVARVRFGPKADPKVTVLVVRNRVALALPVLPEIVKQAGVEVKTEAARPADTPVVAVALADRGDEGRKPLRAWADAVVARLKAEGALVKPEVFPGPDVELARLVRVDREACAKLGVAEADVDRAVRAAGWGLTPDAMKKRPVTSAKGEQVPLGAVAEFKGEAGPAAVLRVDLYPAVRITGAPPAGTTAADAARRCAALAEAERTAGHRPDGFGVVNLTGR